MKINNILKLSLAYSKLIFSQQQFWGKKGSGILFICSEDRTMFLTHRSSMVMDGNCWGVPGGAVQRGYSDLESAKNEVEEELGELPSEMTYITQTSFISPGGNFQYTTFIFDIPLKSKENWNITLNWENTDAKWFELDKPPSVRLHFGVPHVYNLLPKENKVFTLSKEQLEEINKNKNEKEVIIPADDEDDYYEDEDEDEDEDELNNRDKQLQLPFMKK